MTKNKAKKLCPRCRREKIRRAFNKNKRCKDGLQSCCRECQKKQNNTLYATSKDRREKIKKNTAKTRAKVKSIIAKAKRSGCLLCPENITPCLDLHHKDSDSKEVSIGNAVRLGWTPDRIKAELSKCVVLCANCHRKVHAGLAICP